MDNRVGEMKQAFILYGKPIYMKLFKPLDRELKPTIRIVEAHVFLNAKDAEEAKAKAAQRKQDYLFDVREVDLFEVNKPGKWKKRFKLLSNDSWRRRRRKSGKI